VSSGFSFLRLKVVYETTPEHANKRIYQFWQNCINDLTICLFKSAILSFLYF
jgi:hypothetical protein